MTRVDIIKDACIQLGLPQIQNSWVQTLGDYLNIEQIVGDDFEQRVFIAFFTNTFTTEVDEVVTVANYSSLPITGILETIYITLNDNLTYRWDGASYVILNPTPSEVITVANFASLPITGVSETIYITLNDKTTYIWTGSSYEILNPAPDEVISVVNFASLPITGVLETIYITLDDNLTYRWSGSSYILLNPASNISGSDVIQNSLTSTVQWSPLSNGSSLVNATHTANQLYIAPFIMSSNYLVNKLSFETLGSTGSSIYVGVYLMDSNFLPTGSPVIVSGAISNNTLGLKTYTLPSAYLLQKGVKYGLALLATVASCTTRSVVGKNLLGTNVTGAINNTCYSAPGFVTMTANPVMIQLDFRTPGIYLARA